MSPSSTLLLEAGDARLAIDVERGGRLASWRVDGEELLVGPPDGDDRSIRWGCFLMAPWAGRLADGRYRDAEHRLVQLPRSHGRHAIHGLLWDRSWTVEQSGRNRAVLRCDLPGAGWPAGWVRHEVRLTAMGVELEATVTADQAMPVAIGWHPWFRRVGDVSLGVDAATVLATERMIPTGEIVAVRGRTDLRHGPQLGRRRLDHAYLDARSPAVIGWPGRELRLAWSPSPSTLVVHTPPGSLCVEPQTAWPNAAALVEPLRATSGLRDLAPGGSLRASMTMTLRRLG